MVTGRRNFVIEGDEKRYLCVDIKDTNNSKVMIPENTVKASGLREAIGSIKLVREIMFNKPRELDDHYRVRQANIKKRIEEGGIRQLIQGIRDLSWREHYDRLTNTDKRLLARLIKKLQREVTVAHEMPKASVKTRILNIINSALETHTQRQGLVLE